MKSNNFLFFLIVFFLSSILGSKAIAQLSREDTVLVCHFDEWPQTQAAKDRIKQIDIQSDYCDKEKLRKLSEFKNVTKFSWNSYLGTEIDIDISSFKKLKDISIVNCPNVDLEKILSSVSNKENVENLYISSSKLEEIPAVVYNEYKGLKRLTFYRSNISIFSTNSGLDSLEYLNLSDCKLNKIPRGWSRFKKLSSIDLGDNKTLFSCNSEFFAFVEELKSLNNLKKVFFSNTGIQVIPKELFETSIEVFGLAGNDIRRLPVVDSVHLKNINVIILSRNNKELEVPDYYKRYVSILGKKE